jgi:hypothetical protein
MNIEAEMMAFSSQSGMTTQPLLLHQLCTVFFVGVVKRYSKTEKKQTRIPRPLLIAEYNKFMGGTGLMDENINRYRIGI